jgi:nicotinate phosphoribosyltransferase
MVAFAEHLPLEIPRIVLADFKNDVVRAALDTLDAYWPRYRDAYSQGDSDGVWRWTLNGVRIDTAGTLLDASLTDPADKGVSPALVRTLRAALDSWSPNEASLELTAVAEEYCRRVQIFVTGGFNAARIAQFEEDRVPVDAYGVGSSLLANDKTTGTDFTMDIVRAKIGGEWRDVAKVGRRAGENPDLRRVDLTEL